MNTMEWPRLLNAQRLGTDRIETPEPSRSPYTVDSDRIVFCSAFRRLQDKTQVFPLAENDYVRTRLTHSLEVASVGRSLGARVGAVLLERRKLEGFHASDFGAIISAAALAHDLGNPPFGHSGEDAIRYWFETSKTTEPAHAELSDAQREDLRQYEGNAQGFRVISKLQMPDNPGLRLTCATLGAFSKYPRGSHAPGLAELGAGVSSKKFGFFHAEYAQFQTVAQRTGLLQRTEYAWARHPLAFLTEAADDICYRIVDYEDGYRLKHLEYAEVRDAFVAVIGDEKDGARCDRMRDHKDGIAFLRARAIGVAIEQAAAAFLQREEELLCGTFDEELLDVIPAADALRRIKERSRETIYSTQRGVEIEAAGYEVLGGLLEVLFGAVDDVARRGKAASQKSRKLLKLIPGQFLGENRVPAPAAYDRLLSMMDFVTGMTDSYALALYRKVRGISLP